MIKRAPAAALFVSAALLVGIATHEGYVDVAVPPVPGDVPTHGFGSTGPDIRLGDKTDPVRALIRLAADADQKARAVKRCAPVPMYQHEFEAFVNLTYNIGEGAFCGSSIPRKLKAGDYAAACGTILEFVCGPATDAQRAKPGERCYRDDKPLRYLRGLDNRRQAEYRQCVGTEPLTAPAPDRGARDARAGRGES